ncbi:GNAT family N-acetyltransferase [Fulvivirgaceae bacterium BMA10]|uniref:GNAT family N-acetyltransferase n=1 Tax=Splendidivirga corallicola TaxID=3051826 RepID=A0ABT8KME7_9BACT|nr:GNAT family N-acetyltransferase [Fulvivirgaceae bacterium BMA10]
MEFLVAKTEEDFNIGKALFLEYANELGIDLHFQNFEEELDSITKQYTSPSGALLLLKEKNKAIGCVGIRKLEGNIGELKRMFIKKEYRNKGFGKPLLKKGIEMAKVLNYHKIRLDTLPTMEKALKIYTAIGFKEIKPYRYNPIVGTKFLELEIKNWGK